MQNLFWILPLFLLFHLLKTPKVKGLIGELFIRFLAKIKLPKDVYHAIHNVTLTTDNGTTQIDHIFVSQFGVFVVETKNMKGWIFGGEHQAQWTQTIFRVKNKFQNPLRQNYKHVKTLEAILQIPPEAIVSVVVFTGSCTLKTSLPANVTRDAGYIDYIKSYREPILSASQVKLITEQITSGRLKPSLKTDREHVKNLKSRHQAKPDQECPRCGRAMVLRTAKKGAHSGNQFWGCSGYPSCRFTEQVTQ